MTLVSWLLQVAPVAITFLDGNKGVLQYRGYPIDQLAEHSSYLEVCYLLIHGDLPNQTETGRIRQRHYKPHDVA